MTMDMPSRNKSVIAPLRAAMYDFTEAGVKAELTAIMAADAVVHMAHPFGDLKGPAEFYAKTYAPLLTAMPDLERRDLIVVAGPTGDGAQWVGLCGFYAGTFHKPFLEIPPTGHLTGMRYHEFFRLEDGKISEIQSIWDIPEVMMQANAWPMAPSLGREWLVPGPATQDGIVPGPYDETHARASTDVVVSMMSRMSSHPSEGGPEIMQLEKFWHPRFNWYGPAGIGSTRGISGFRNWHQIPFLNALPDRKGGIGGVKKAHLFGDADYVAVTGWPNMQMSVTGDGWLGIVPSGQKITMRTLDFWRVDNGLIRENWVLVDILDVYSQLGVDVFARLREFNKARSFGDAN